MKKVNIDKAELMHVIRNLDLSEFAVREGFDCEYLGAFAFKLFTANRHTSYYLYTGKNGYTYIDQDSFGESDCGWCVVQTFLEELGYTVYTEERRSRVSAFVIVGGELAK